MARGKSNTTQEKPKKAIGRRRTKGAAKPATAKDQPPLFSGGEKKAILYMPLDSIRARVYLAHGLMYPFIYDTIGGTGSYQDEQSARPDALTLNETPPPCREGQLIMHLLLTEEERRQYVLQNNACYYPRPLPVSRIVKIEVPVLPHELDTYLRGWISPDIPVNEKLFYSDPRPISPFSTDTVNKQATNYFSKSVEIAEAIKRYDQLLGLFAFLKNTERYFSLVTGKYSDYPEIFFVLYGILSDETCGRTLEDMSDKYRILRILLGLPYTPSEIEAEVCDMLKNQNVFFSRERAREFAKKIWGYYNKPSSLEECYKALFQENYETAIKLLQEAQIPRTAKEESAILIMLYMFGQRDSNARRNLKQRFHAFWNLDTHLASLVLGAMGFYYGYTLLDARETKLYSVHPWLVKFIDCSPPIKFLFTSTFERKLVETIFHRAFESAANRSELFSLFENITNDRQIDENAPVSFKAVFNDHTGHLHGIPVRRYELNALGKLLQRFNEICEPVVNQSSIIGRRLFYYICRLASSVKLTNENFSFEYKNPSDVRAKTAEVDLTTGDFSITRDELFEHIANGTIPVSEHELKIWLDELKEQGK